MAFEFVVIIFVMADDVFLIILDDKLERKLEIKSLYPATNGRQPAIHTSTKGNDLIPLTIF